MNVDHLRTAIALLRPRTVNGTAAAQGLAPSSVSDRIRRLETELGVRLFRRDRAGMRPTAPGRAFLAVAAEAIESLDAAAARLTDGAAVVVGAQASIADTLLPAVLDEVRRRRTDLVTTIRPGLDRDRLLAELDRDELDAVVLLDTGGSVGDLGYASPGGELDHCDLREVPMIAVAGPGHPLLGRPVAAAELRREATLIGQESRCAFWMATRRWLGPGTDLTAVGGLAQVREWVAAGRGVAVLPDFAVRDDLIAGRIRALDLTPPPLWLRLIWRASRAAEEPLRTLLYALSQA
ncbi:MAG TPA: LysR family transcriptional regulator [Microlunatus sp.]|nr:LysR family transcriptional regulator [Microlunatus sp.]